MRKDTEYLSIPGHVSSKEAGEMLGVSDERINQFIRDKRLPSKLVSGMWMIPIEAVEQFKRAPAGRARKQPPVWRTYRSSINLLGTGIEVHIRPEQEEALEKKLKAMSKGKTHLLTGSIQRYIMRDKTDRTLVSIWLVWKDNELPDEATHEQEMEAFQAEFSDVLDWDTAVFSSKEGVVYT